jgi:hypothetical protein
VVKEFAFLRNSVMDVPFSDHARCRAITAMTAISPAGLAFLILRM